MRHSVKRLHKSGAKNCSIQGQGQVNSAGASLIVVGSESLSERDTVYNLEVEGFHTYFAGRQGVWAHNMCDEQSPGEHVRDAERVVGKTIDPSISSGGSIESLVDALKKAGVKGDLDTIKRNAELGQPGAIGELEAMERWIAEGRSVESLPEVQQGPKNPDFKVDGEITEVKTRNEPFAPDDDYISNKINHANRQIKKSGQTGPDAVKAQGQVEIQLNNQAAESIRTNPNEFSEIESQVRRQFRPDQSRSLKRVAIYLDGKLYGEWVRTPGNQIVQTVP